MAEAQITILILLAIQCLSIALCVGTRSYKLFFVSTGMLTGGALFALANSLFPNLWPANAGMGVGLAMATILLGNRFNHQSSENKISK